MLKFGEKEWYTELANVVTLLRTPQYPSTLVDCLVKLVPFDHSVIFAYHGNDRPLDLYDNFGPELRKIAVTDYQEGHYLLDPFFIACQNNVPEGIYRIREVAPDRFLQSEYFRSHFVRTDLAEEICYVITLSNEVRIVISLMRASNNKAFSEKELNKLKAVEPFVRATAQKHWEELPGQYRGKKNNTEALIYQQQLDNTFRNTGRSVLTSRECEVVGHILRGHSANSISKELSIAPGTVKIHRRNIYGKLAISSQEELLSMFLTTLVKHPEDSDSPHS